MADIEKDPKDLEVTDATADTPEEDLARAALKDLVRSAGDALGGLLDDEPVATTFGAATTRDESSVESAQDADASSEQIEWEMASTEFEETVGEESVEDIEARQQEEIGDAGLEEVVASDEGLSEEEARLADEELGPAEFIEADRAQSIIEALLFASQRPVSLATIKTIFKGSNIRTRDISRALDQLASEYAGSKRGVTLEEINGGWQLRTKVDNSEYLKRLSKTRPFRLSGPALETLSIVAYKQPLTKHEVDEIRGVESGHLVRALMERGLVCFQGKSEGPGKPMLYGTTRKFLETFGLRNIKELPTLAEIDELLPEGIGDEVEADKPKLADLTDAMSETVRSSYSEGEDELQKITDSLTQIDTSSEFFEQEKIRQRDRRDAERAANIREAIAVGEAVEDKDSKWLKRYEAKLAAQADPANAQAAADAAAEAGEAGDGDEFRKDIEGLTQDLGASNAEVAESDEAAEAEFTSESDWDDLGDGDGDSDGVENSDDDESDEFKS